MSQQVDYTVSRWRDGHQRNVTLDEIACDTVKAMPGLGHVYLRFAENNILKGAGLMRFGQLQRTLQARGYQVKF